ncbi:MAG: helix-turn-helix transcriptional regulator [Chloroflexota bacterium]
MIKTKNNGHNLGAIIRQHRIMAQLTLGELATRSGVSISHLGRIERGERFPSARVLRSVAEPLDFNEDELFASAGYLSPRSIKQAGVIEDIRSKQLDPVVVGMLKREPYEVQRAVIVILAMLKSFARQTAGCPLGIDCYASCYWWHDGSCNYKEGMKAGSGATS